MPHHVARPRRSLIRMARRARIGNLVFVSHHWRDEAESVSMNHRICRAFRFNRRHVASDALTTYAAFLVVRVFLDSRCSWAVR